MAGLVMWSLVRSVLVMRSAFRVQATGLNSNKSVKLFAKGYQESTSMVKFLRLVRLARIVTTNAKMQTHLKKNSVNIIMP